VYKIRELISKYSNDLYILDELSKNRTDTAVIGNIIFKGQNNLEFREEIKGENTIYSQNTLSRIATYEEYYEYNNEKCFIAQLAGNYSLSKDTREYLFNKYKDDNTILRKLNNPSLYNYPELKIRIEEILFNKDG